MGRRGVLLQRGVDLPHGAVVSVNVGRARAVDRNGEPATTAIWKSPLSGRVRARGVNLDGDEQADRSVHGGYDKAVYAYAVEDTRWWESELGRAIGPGGFGENLTVQGLHLVDSVVGERWAVGTAVLEGSEPRAFRAGSSESVWKTARSRGALLAPPGPVRTCASSTRARSAPATRCVSSHGPTTASRSVTSGACTTRTGATPVRSSTCPSSGPHGVNGQKGGCKGWRNRDGERQCLHRCRAALLVGAPTGTHRDRGQGRHAARRAGRVELRPRGGRHRDRRSGLRPLAAV